MDGFLSPQRVNWPQLRVAEIGSKPRSLDGTFSTRDAGCASSPPTPLGDAREEFKVIPSVSSSARGDRDRVVLDGSRGEGGGQILRTALTLSLLTGRPFRMVKIRANRDKPGLRPQHQKAVEAAAMLGAAKVTGNAVGSRELTFSPARTSPRDLVYRHRHGGLDRSGASNASPASGTAIGKPSAARAHRRYIQPQGAGVLHSSMPRGEPTWRPSACRSTLTMTAAGFYPRGGGELEALDRAGGPAAYTQTDARSLAPAERRRRRRQPARRHRSADA